MSAQVFFQLGMATGAASARPGQAANVENALDFVVFQGPKNRILGDLQAMANHLGWASRTGGEGNGGFHGFEPL